MSDEHTARLGRAESFGLVAAAYLVALAVALWLIGQSEAGAVGRLFAADVAATAVIFAFSMRWNNGSVYDPYWSVVPPLVCLYWIDLSFRADPIRQFVVTALVLAWAVRLTWNWARGWPGIHHEDWRYVDLYATSGLPKWAISFFGIHLFPTIQVFLGCLVLIPALARGHASFHFLDAVALVATGGAIIIEAVADEQLRRFNATKRPGDILQDGLWAWSRHPNYFGEILFWWGLFLFGFAADPRYWWTVVGPLAMTLMFHFASIPMLDRRSVARRPGYAEHMRRVSAIVPRRPG